MKRAIWLVVAATGAPQTARCDALVGYWNFNNMTTVLPASLSDGATPGIESSAPGPMGLISRNTFSNMGASGPTYEGFRADYAVNFPSPNRLNALGTDPDGFGLRLGNGAAEFNRNGQVVWFPLASMAGLTDLRLSFAMYTGGPTAYTSVRVFLNSAMSRDGWTLADSLAPDGNGWRLAAFELGSGLAGDATPWVGVQLDGGGTFANFVMDNVQFTAVPEPASAVLILGTAAVGSRRRRP